MLPSASSFKLCVLFAGLALFSCTTVPAETATAQQQRMSRESKNTASEFRIAPPPASQEANERAQRETVEQVLTGERSSELTEVKLPASVMGLEPGDVTGDPIAQSRERARLQRTDAEIAGMSGAGEFEKRLGDFDRVLGVSEEDSRPLSPSFTESTKKIRQLFSVKRYEDALVETNELLLHFSKSALLWTMKGTLHLRLSQSDLSLSAYEKAFDLEPTPRLLAQIEQLRRVISTREGLRQKKLEQPAQNIKPVDGRVP
ncbi:MAG: hypothetical protein RL189_761 [Pseudomonadota bacterium]|jgi:tetratricopeptide (TPR) repeat protein